MKKFAPIAIIALLAVAFTSCKKDWSCECKDKDGNVDFTYTYPKVAKSSAKTSCDAAHSTWATDGGSCKLK